MMISLLLGDLMKVPRLKFNSLHSISNEVCTVQPIVAVRYTNLSITITRMTTSNSSTMMTSLVLGVLGQLDDSLQDKIRSPSRHRILHFSKPRLRSLPHIAPKYIWQFEGCSDYCDCIV
jgi:hypothetical protein